MIRAAVILVNQRLGTADPGRPRRRRASERARRAGIDLDSNGIEIINARLSRAQRRLCRLSLRAAAAQGLPVSATAQRLVNNDRNHLRRLHGGAGRRRRDGDRRHAQLLDGARRRPPRASTPSPVTRVIGVSIALCRGRTVFVADTAVHDMPNAEELADIAEEAAGVARRLGYEPRVAMLAYSTFGHPRGERAERVQEAVRDPRQAPRRFRI